MDNPIEIKKLSQQRLEEALILIENNMKDGAFYLAGYSVELALKAKICEQYGIPNLFKPTEQNLKKSEEKASGSKKSDEEQSEERAIDPIRNLVKTHNLRTLLILSCLRDRFNKEKANNQNFLFLFSLLFNLWNEQVRYKPCGHFNDMDIKELITLLPELISWIEKN